MEQSPGRLEPAAAHSIAIIVALAALMLFPSWPFRDLWTPDEPRYMEVAREMTVAGNYLVPHLNGEIYPDKPPMFFWLAAGFYKLGFGYNSGRSVAALAGIGTLLIVFALARRTMPRPGPLIAALVTLTSVLFFEAKAGLLDPLLMFFVTAAIFAGHRALQPETKRTAAWWLGAYALAALGSLTKGPVGFLLPGLVILAYGLFNRTRVRGGGWAHAAGAGLFLVLTLGWLVPAVTAGGEAYRNEILFKQTLGRVMKSYSHQQPFYYFVARFPIDFLPWSLLVIAALVAAARRWRNERRAGPGLPLLWFAVIFIFHSCISGKRYGYLMPLIPAAGLMVGEYVSNGLLHGFPWPRWHRALLRLTCAFGLLASAAVAAGPWLMLRVVEHNPKLAHLAEQIEHLTTARTYIAAAVVGALMAAISVYGLRAARDNRRGVRVIGAFVAVMFVVSLAADLVIAPKLNTVKSGRFFCLDAARVLEQADRVHLLRNDMSGVYNLYTGRLAMPPLKEAEDVQRALSSDAKVAIIADEHRWEKTMGKKPDSRRVAVRRSVGSRVMILVVNWSPE